MPMRWSAAGRGRDALAEVRTHVGLLELVPLPGGEYPEISWGDYFFSS